MRSKQTRGNTDSASRNSSEQYLERAYLETTVGESPGRRRVALSSGSDCDAVWPCAIGI